MKASVLPALVRLNVSAPGSKSPLPAKFPVISKLPSPATAIPEPDLLPPPPTICAQAKSPAASNLDTYRLYTPPLVENE